jgi:hypothetical protein
VTVYNVVDKSRLDFENSVHSLGKEPSINVDNTQENEKNYSPKETFPSFFEPISSGRLNEPDQGLD